MDYIKTKSAAKLIFPEGEKLEKRILDTNALIASVVGGTLGPGGGVVVIERNEYGLGPLVTKDGVTVFKAFGFNDPVQHTILESVRDASTRTATEAGDGTTTATILYEAFVRYTTQYRKANPQIPPIQIIRDVQKLLNVNILPLVDKLTIPADFLSPEGQKLLNGVARISANGDTELADAVMKCFAICGDEGNVTIVDSTGKTGIEVEKIEGYPIPVGYEETGRFATSFVNEPGTQRVVYDKPMFILYFGRIVDMNSCLDILIKIQEGGFGNKAQDGFGHLTYTQPILDCRNIVIIATGFSETVLAEFSKINQSTEIFKIFPLVAPQTAMANSQKDFLEDIAAVVDCQIFDPLNRPLSQMQLSDLGNCETYDNEETLQPAYRPKGVRLFEASRYRSSVVGFADEERLLRRVDEVKTGLLNPASEYDRLGIQERLAKLSDGIAKLKIFGASNGELKERRDRAEDAVCAVRGAIKHGCLVGGGWTIQRIIKDLEALDNPVAQNIVIPSLRSVIDVLYKNAGVVLNALPESLLTRLSSSLLNDPTQAEVLDLSSGEVVPALSTGLLDSKPALTEALKNSVSIATLWGTAKGCIVFPRDHQAELNEARDSLDFARSSGIET